MRITTKFIGSSALLIALTAILSGSNYWANRQVDRALATSYTQTQTTVATVVQLEVALQEQITALSRLSVLPEDATAFEHYEQSREQFFQALDQLAITIPSSDQTSHLRIEGIREQHSYLATLAKRLRKNSGGGLDTTPDEVEASNVARSLKFFEQSTGNYTKALLKSAREETVAYSEQSKILRQRTAWFAALSFLSVIGLLYAQFHYLLRPVIRSLQQLQTGVDQIGRSQLEVVPNIQVDTGDELQTLAEAFNKMGANLSESYHALESRVEERTKSLHQTNQALLEEVSDRVKAEANLQQALTKLKKTQLQLLQTEKMSSLGQLVAGVAHEINNPVSFIQGNLAPAEDYMNSLLSLLKAYQAHYPEASEQLQEAIDGADLDFIQTDFPRLLNSMKTGSVRIKAIVQSLKTFSRLDESETKSADLHEGLESALMILASQLSGTPQRPDIQVVRQYGDLPLVYCYPGQLNQVFMGLLTNAIDALTQSFSTYSKTAHPSKNKMASPTITLTTEADEAGVRICIADNGIGMDSEVCQQIFNPFFTTKAVGSGMGLGLAMSYQIVVANHQGHIDCESTPGEGTTFTVKIPLTLKLQTKPAVNLPGLAVAGSQEK